MKPSLQKLQKFFKLEAERGFDNRAVLGGLDRILDSWEIDARADNLPEETIQLVDSRLRDYPRLSEDIASRSVERLMEAPAGNRRRIGTFRPTAWRAQQDQQRGRSAPTG